MLRKPCKLMPQSLGYSLFADRGVDAARASEQQLAAAALAREIANSTLELSQQHSARLQEDPAWGLVVSALWRVQEYAEGSIGSFLVSPVTAEIVARTVLEGSVNIRYILAGDRNARLYSYFDAYICQELKQNEKWAEAAATLPFGDEAAHHHQAGREQKAKVLAFQRHLVDELFRNIGVSISATEKWGTLLSRFEQVGLGVEYRTTYAALCSQAHNDAEDLINVFTLQAAGADDRMDALRAETRAFSWFAVMLGFRQYVRATTDYWQSFDLHGSRSDLLTSMCEAVDDLARHAAGAVAGR